MILYNLRCPKEHDFEAWFRDSEVYDDQAAAGEVRCPVCGSRKVTKAPMAPRLTTSKTRQRAAREVEQAGKARRALTELRKHVEKNFDYVGPAFADEARKIHYGETEDRNIYGETDGKDAKALEEEGVPIQRVPWIQRENS